MRMLITKPPLRLSGRVIELWSLKGCPQGRYSGLPKPYVEFIISLSGSHIWQESEDSTKHKYETGWLTPVQAGPRFAETFGPLHLIGARINIETAATLFGSAVNINAGPPVPLHQLIGCEASRLRERLLELGSEAERIEHLGQWVERRLADQPILELPSLEILADKGWRTDALAEIMGLSSRGLHKKFKTKLGIGPKFWLQLNRFDSLLSSGLTGQGLAETAAIYGYSDQSHMSSEFKRFAGKPPQEYIKTRRNEDAPDEAPHFLPNAN